MKKLLFSTALVASALLTMNAHASAASVQSISFCSCCSPDLSQECASPCATDAASGGECMVTVVYDAKTPPKGNQLNGVSLKELDLGTPSRADLERFRRFLESERRKAVGDYKKAERAYKRKRIDDAGLAAAKTALNEAMVNYNHGIYAYQLAAGVREE